jgi:decaprenylphospho-beta-D-erythro-pentofuranosid-2-ulose 2-reductase
VSLGNRFAAHMVPLGRGYLCGVSSVAGDRGRQSNYLYGSTKAGFSTYLDGLRNRLYRSGVAVITVKPGFVDTSMTWGLLNPKSPLVAAPERVARDIARAIRKRKNTVYTPWFWALVMLVIRLVPEPIFKRMSL